MYILTKQLLDFDQREDRKRKEKIKQKSEIIIIDATSREWSICRYVNVMEYTCEFKINCLILCKDEWSSTCRVY